MKIISWDVGIIHLAYCIMEYSETENRFKIYDWSQINLIDNNEEANICKVELKKDKICGCTGKYFYQDDNGELVYLCGKHKSKYDYTPIDFDDYYTKKDEKTKCCFLEKECGTGAYYYHGTDGYCKSHAKLLLKRLNDSKKLNSVKKVNSMKVSIDELRYNLITILDSMPHLLKVEKVLIENQPSLKNPKMKAISSTIYDYFLIRGIIDKSKNNSHVKMVKYISPSNKLKVDEDNTIKTLSKTADNKKYKLTKQLGIQYCKQLIKHDEENLKFLGTQKKKDDLCDAFLQGAYYLSLVKN